MDIAFELFKMSLNYMLVTDLLRVVAQVIFAVCFSYALQKLLWYNYCRQIKNLKRHVQESHLLLDPLVYPANPDKTNQHQWMYLRMERLIGKMSADIHVVNRVKFLTGKFCKAVFEDYELLNWISMQIDVHNEAEARHLATLLVYYGYVLPVHDRFLPVQRNGEFYRFQIPKFYPSISYEIRDEEYAVHLNVRVMSSSKLARYEKENLAKLKEKFSDHWDEILRCAKYRSTTFQEMDDTDSELFQFRERAFWNVHRPKPGTFHSTEKDYRKLKAYTPQNSTETDETNDDTTREDVSEPLNLDRRNISQSHPGNNHTPYCVQYAAYDPFVTHPISYNYWLVKKIGIWKTNNDQLALSSCRTKLWAFSLRDILSDPVGKDNFKMFLEKEFSYENLKFWDAVVEFQKLPLSQVAQAAQDIWTEYIEGDGINIDSHSREVTKQNMAYPNRYTFDVAAKHVYHLMETDSYQRYLKSKMYKDKVEESNANMSISVWEVLRFYTRRG